MSHPDLPPLLRHTASVLIGVPVYLHQAEVIATPIERLPRGGDRWRCVVLVPNGRHFERGTVIATEDDLLRAARVDFALRRPDDPATRSRFVLMVGEVRVKIDPTPEWVDAPSRLG